MQADTTVFLQLGCILVLLMFRCRRDVPHCCVFGKMLHDIEEVTLRA